MSDSLMSKGNSEKRDSQEKLAAITTEKFINKKKKDCLNSLTRITCVETLSLPSLGQPPSAWAHSPFLITR